MSREDARSAAKAAAQTSIDTASHELARGEITEREWQSRVSDSLATAYLGDADPRWQSGFDGDETLWREARELVLDAIPAGGTLLDVGCANGYLMECLALWARKRGHDLTVYGLELSPDLADAARRRLPVWADRIFTGNVSDWIPPHRFTYIRTGLEYVPQGREPSLIQRVLSDFTEPGGRLIVGPVSSSELSSAVAAFVEAGIPDPGRTASTDHNGKTRHVIWASSSSHSDS